MFRILSKIILAAVAAVLISNSASYAQTCGKSYKIRRGDSLFAIANRTYRNGFQWTVIFNSNQSVLGSDPSVIYPGTRVRLPCIDGSQLPPPRADEVEPTPVAASAKTAAPSLLLVTAGDYEPYTDQKLPDGGLVTDLLSTAFKKRTKEYGGPKVSISWVNDWSAHLPLAIANKFDGVFPWYRPDCEAPNLIGDAKYRCGNFKFSQPVFQVLIMLFVKSGSDLKFDTDSEIIGKTLCRPKGYFSFDFDQKGRNWLANDQVKLARPVTVGECFKMLDRGEVDAVSMNEITGKDAINDLKLGGKVVVLKRPMSVVGLHVLTSKTNPHGDKLLEHVNKAVASLRESGEYDALVEKHLAPYWQLN